MNPDSPDDPMRVLRKLSLVKDGKPTNAGYLAFAKDDVPSTLFQAGRFKADSVIIDSKAFKLDLFGELDNAMEFVRKHLMNGIVITGKPQHDIKHDYPEEAIREIVPHHCLLVPGVGAQGGSLEEVCKYGMTEDCGLLVNSSRGIIYASSGEDFAEVAAMKARELQEQMAGQLEAFGI